MTENRLRTTLPKETEWQRRQRRDRERTEHVAANGPGCQICGNVPKRGLDQDHDHRTGKTRGYLCHACNRRLWVGVGVDWLCKAIDYLSGEPLGTTACAIATYRAAKTIPVRLEP